MKYKPDNVWDGSNYYGGTLAAMVKLGKSKGYTLVGCDNRGVNAIFIRNDMIENNFVLKNTEELYKPPQFGIKVNGKYTGYKQSSEKMIDV